MRAMMFVFILCGMVFGHLSGYWSGIDKDRQHRREACAIGWRHAAARYDVYDKVSLDEIKSDAVTHCKDWVLK